MMIKDYKHLIKLCPYGTPAIKVCESEMLSKNKLNKLNEIITKTKIKTVVKIEDKDNTIPKTKAKNKNKTKDKDNTIPKTKKDRT